MVLLALFVIIFLIYSYKKYKEEKANERLDEIYMKRLDEEERVEKLIREKPQEIILLSSIPSDTTLRFIGRLDNLDNVQAKDWDFTLVDQTEHIYKDGKWYELIDDISHNYGLLQKWQTRISLMASGT
jgi:hypothetical protein